MSADVLLVTADESLIAAVPRLCALAGAACEVDRDSSAVRGAWRYAATILVGADVAPALSGVGLARRDRVILLATDITDVTCWQAALALGASTVLRLPHDEAALVDALRAPSTPAGDTARVIAVTGGRGGAGASTFAAAMAITAGRASSAVLIDGDPLGGGLDVLVGAESTPGLRWNELAATRGTLDAAAFASAICATAGVGLLSWGRPGESGLAIDVDAVGSVLDAACRSFSTVVIDVPRSLTRVTACLLDAADASVVLVPADVRSVSATAALLASIRRRIGVPLLVVRDPGGHGLSANDVSASLGLPITETLRSDPSLQTSALRGEPPVRRTRCALTQVCELVLSAASAGGAE
ncbi:MAG: septum site-determining protein Ssd [Mycobacteriales bacterium]